MKKLKEKLSAKLSKKGGFTLVEMLIVVAIIAILIAVSIPLVNSSLEKAREAVDQANLRNATGLANILYLTTTDADTAFATEKEYVYVVDDSTHQGKLVDSATTPTPVGVKPKCKCTAAMANVELKVKLQVVNGELVVKPTWEIGTDGKTVSPSP